MTVRCSLVNVCGCVQVPDWFQNVTALSKYNLEDIGLKDYSTDMMPTVLLSKLLGPIGFFFVTILQLKFFHTKWHKSTDFKTARETATHMQRVQSARRLEPDEQIGKPLRFVFCIDDFD